MCLLHAAPFTPTVLCKNSFCSSPFAAATFFFSFFLNLMISLYSEAGQKDSTLTTTSSLSFDLRPNQRLGASGYCFIASHRNNSHLHHLLREGGEGGGQRRGGAGGRWNHDVLRVSSIPPRGGAAGWVGEGLWVVKQVLPCHAALPRVHPVFVVVTDFLSWLCQGLSCDFLYFLR